MQRSEFALSKCTAPKTAPRRHRRLGHDDTDDMSHMTTPHQQTTLAESGSPLASATHPTPTPVGPALSFPRPLIPSMDLALCPLAHQEKPPTVISLRTSKIFL